MTQLTEARIRAAKPKGKPYKLRDSRGLYLLVTPPGGRLWRLRYRHAGRESMVGPRPPRRCAEASCIGRQPRRSEAR